MTAKASKAGATPQTPTWSDATAALAEWDAGRSVFTVEMGGLGPGYEQCIQILVWEIVRDNEPLPEGRFGTWGEKAVARCDPTCGFSGAQVGAAKQLAHRFLKYGHRATLDKVEPDRRIQVSRAWPRPPEQGTASNASAPQAPPRSADSPREAEGQKK
jgi:hypothetical protein